MDMEFREKQIRCLRERAVEVMYQEETAELILPDSYPDVRAIADASAVCCLRDKEIATGAMTASGAFQAVILYDAEDGEICAMEAWMPFSVRLNRETILAEDVGCVALRIRAVDGRVLNSRKIMVRVSYAVRITVYETAPLCLHEATADEQVQLLRRPLSTGFPTALAEKPIQLSENIEIRGAASPVRRVLKAIPELQLTETKAVDDKAVVKGVIRLHLVCLLENGGLYAWDTDIPWSQYLGFEEEIEEGTVSASAILADFQLEQNESGGYLVSVGIQLQALLWRKIELELIADGYSPSRFFTAVYETVTLPEPLDELSIPCTVESQLRSTPNQIVDCTAWVDFPVCRRGADEISAITPVTMRVCYLNQDGRICGETVKAEAIGVFALSEIAECCADAERTGNCYVSMAGDKAVISCGVCLQARCFTETAFETMVSATIGDALPQDDQRPSLVVRRAVSGEPLWNLAKQYNSTVSEIRNANGIGADCAPDDGFLLIPVS